MTKKEKIAEYDEDVKQLIADVEEVFENEAMMGEERVERINFLTDEFRKHWADFDPKGLTIDFAKFTGGREPCFDTGEGAVYFQVGKDGGTIEFGTACNTGLLVDGVYEFDFDETYQWNLQELGEVIQEKYNLNEEV